MHIYSFFWTNNLLCLLLQPPSSNHLLCRNHFSWYNYFPPCPNLQFSCCISCTTSKCGIKVVNYISDITFCACTPPKPCFNTQLHWKKCVMENALRISKRLCVLGDCPVQGLPYHRSATTTEVLMRACPALVLPIPHVPHTHIYIYTHHGSRTPQKNLVKPGWSG